jgi:hypothetical protein
MLMDDDGVVPGRRKVLENVGDLDGVVEVASIRAGLGAAILEEEDR